MDKNLVSGNSLAHHNGHGFTTKDSDHDKHGSNCVVMLKGAWWFNRCTKSDLNGEYFIRNQPVHTMVSTGGHGKAGTTR